MSQGCVENECALAVCMLRGECFVCVCVCVYLYETALYLCVCVCVRECVLSLGQGISDGSVSLALILEAPQCTISQGWLTLAVTYLHI